MHRFQCYVKIRAPQNTSNICAINAGYICIMLREAEHYTRDIALSQSDSAISNILHGDVGTSRRRVPESSAIYDIL